jgi:hypothetical protein
VGAGLAALLVAACAADAPSAGPAAPRAQAVNVEEALGCAGRPAARFAAPAGDSVGERRQALQRYADEVLRDRGCEAQQHFAHLGIRDAVPISGGAGAAFQIEVGPGGCLDQDLRDAGRFEQTVAMVEHVAGFLGEFHQAMLGQPARTFYRVRMCPKEVAGGDLTIDLAQQRLNIGLSYGWTERGRAPRSAGDIKRWWTEGRHVQAFLNIQDGLIPGLQLAGFRNDVRAMQALWRLIDPMSGVRALGRVALQGVAERLSGALTPLAAPQAGNRGALRRLLDRHVVGSARADQTRQCASQWVDAMSDADIALLAQAWHERLMRGASWKATSDAVVGMTQRLSQNQIEITQECGLFAFGNLKMVGVDVHALLSPEAGRIESFLAVREVNDVQVRQSAFLCFYLIDDVDVSVQLLKGITADGALESVTLLDALEQEFGIDCASASP